MSKDEIHIGKLLKQKMKEKNVLQADVAERLEIDPATLFRWLRISNLSKHKIRQIGIAAELDLVEMFPEMFKPEDLTIRQASIPNWQRKYYDLLEQQNEMQKRIILLQEELAEYRNQSSRNGTDSEQ